MRASLDCVVLFAGAVTVAACAARAPSLPAHHPADPAAPAGRLAGPPAILRAARPAVAPEPAPPAPPEEHDHDHP